MHPYLLIQYQVVNLKPWTQKKHYMDSEHCIYTFNNNRKEAMSFRENKMGEHEKGWKEGREGEKSYNNILENVKK